MSILLLRVLADQIDHDELVLNAPKDLSIEVEDADDHDIAAAQASLAEMRRSGEQPRPFAEVCAEFTQEALKTEEAFIEARLPIHLTPEPTGGFVVTCPALRGCISQGDTREEALANIREAIGLCAE